jgi:predicted alpha/beta-hydrolase family hydrolase
MHKAEEIKFSAGEKVGKVSGLLILPKGAEALLVVAHGAGAGMRHKFMEEIAQKLADRAVATSVTNSRTWRRASKDRTVKRFSPVAFERRL